VRRAEFDAALLAAVREKGVEVRERRRFSISRVTVRTSR